MPVGLLLTLSAALGWSLFDVTRKGLARTASPVALTAILPLGQVPLLVLWAAALEAPNIPLQSLAPMAASIVLNVLGLLSFMQALRAAPLSLTVPLLSFTPVGTTLLAWGFKHQVPAFAQWGGIVLVVAGAATLGIRSGHWPGIKAYFKAPGVRSMMGAALAWSLTALLDQTALERGANVWYAPALAGGSGLLLLSTLLLLRRGNTLVCALFQMRRRPYLAGSTVLLGAAALAIQLEALRFAPVGFIETVKRGIGMAGAVLFGRLVFQEPLGLSKLMAVLLLTAGVTLVVMGG